MTAENKLPTIGNFVASTIMEIAKGLHEAQEAGREKGVKIFPHSYGDISTPMNIDFDLSISNITEQGKEGNISVFIPLVNVNLKGVKGKCSLESANRIKFTVPVDFVVYNPVNSKNPNYYLEHTQEEYSREYM